MMKNNLVAQLIVAVLAIVSLKASADPVVNRNDLMKDTDDTLFSLNVAYSMSGEDSIYEIKSPTLLACVRKQMAEYKKVTATYQGGASALALALLKTKIRIRIFMYDFTRDKDPAITALESNNIIPDPHVIDESDQKAVNIIGSLGIDPKTHQVGCKIQTSDDILNFVSKIKGLDFKTAASGSSSAASPAVH